MPPYNVTATASQSSTPPTQVASLSSSSRLPVVGASNSPTAAQFHVIPNQPVFVDRPSQDPQQEVPCPVFTGHRKIVLNDQDVKEGKIFNQSSLEENWSSIQQQLRNGSLLEQDVLQILESGFLQTTTGKVLAPLIVNAILRSVNQEPFEPEILRAAVEAICYLPPEQWSFVFGEDFNFPVGSYGEKLHSFIQEQLTSARTERERKIAGGELLDNHTWKALRDFNEQTRNRIFSNSETDLNHALRQLEDFSDVRPSPKIAQLVINEFAEAFGESSGKERENLGQGFEAKLSQICEQLNAIKVDDNRPELTLLQEFRAICALIPVSLKEVWETLNNPTIDNETIENALPNALHYLGFYFPTEQLSEIGVPPSPLLTKMQEVELKSSFYNEVNTSGSVLPRSILGRLVWTLNATDVLGVTKILKALPLPEVEPGTSLATVYTPPPLATPTEMWANVDQREAEFNAFNASTSPKTESLSEETIDAEKEHASSLTANSALEATLEQTQLKAETASFNQLVMEWEADINLGAGPALSTAVPSESTLQQIAQTVLDTLHKIDDALTFPTAMADPTEVLLNVNEHLEAFQAMVAAEGTDPLLEPGPYGPTVAAIPIPTWWETLAPQIYGALSHLSQALVPFANYALAPAAALTRLATNNPHATATAAFFSATAIYNQLCERFPSQAIFRLPGELPANAASDASEPTITESPALHQELIGDKIEEILDTPVAKGQPTLLTSILELMYQSTEHNLLDDTQLLQQVATLLEQHSTKEPEKSYAERIQKAEAQTHGPQDVAQFASPRVKRDTADAEARPLTGDVEQNASDNEANLDQYLAMVDELHRPVVEVDDDIDNDTPVDPELRTAQDVVRLLRSRRSAGWTDASRSNGDRQLATSYAHALASFTDADASRATLDVSVPTHSTFGQCWLNYLSALKNPFFMDWAHAAGLDLSTVTVHPESNMISGQTDRGRVGFTLTDNTGWAGVAGPILKAAKVINPIAKSIPIPSGSRVPIALVAGFYAEQLPASRSEALRRSTELNNNPVFSATVPAELLEQRSEAAVETQKQHIANVYTNHGLVLALSDLVKNKIDNEPMDLGSLVIAAVPNSLFAAKYPIEARRMVSAHRYISAMGWIVPKTVADVRNLVDVLTTTIPESPKYGNYRGALSYPIPLKPTDLHVLDSEFNTFRTEDQAKDFDKLLTTSPPEKGLELALESEIGRELGQRLASKLNVIPTQTSGADLLLAEQLRFLDPAYGQQRNHVAGYHLTQEANGSGKPSEVVSGLEKHLIRTGKASAGTAPALARLLLAGIAPEFLVKNLPDNLVCSSHTWTMLRISVARIERVSPGSSSQMTFEQVMEYGATSAITEGEAIAVDSVSVNPLLDWGIVSGVITANPSGTYTKQQLSIVIEKFNALRVELGRAQEYLTAPVPLRTDIAKAKAARVLGKDFDLEKRCLKNKHVPQSVRTPNYSVLDLFTTGALKRDQWKSIDSRVPMSFIESKIDELGDINTTFESAFTEYYDNLITGSESVFKYMISQLSIEDRKNLEYGKQTYYSVRAPLDAKAFNITPELIKNNLGRHGIVIRSEYQGKIVYFEVFPSTLEIRRRTDLPATLTLGADYVRVPPEGTSPGKYYYTEAGRQMPFDLSAHTRGTFPQENASSRVIIEKIVTPEQNVKSLAADFESKTPNALASDSNVKAIASNAVNNHFITGREKLHDLAKGETEPEAEKRRQEQALDFFLSLIPFKTCVDNIKEGKILDAVLDCTLDVLGFIIPGAGSVGKIGKVAKTGTSLTSRGLKIGRIVGGNLVSSANPFDGVGDAFGAVSNGVYKLGTKASNAANEGIFQIRNLFGLTKAVDPTYLSRRADIAEGVVDINRVAGQTENVKALFKDGNWYAFDEVANRPYGPPLENFRPDSAVALQLTTFRDGSSALTPSRLFDKETFTIQRLSYTDVVVGDDVYRIYPAKPGVLNSINSPDTINPLENFTQTCRTVTKGGKVKRDTTRCLTKQIFNERNIPKKRAQAIEHKRLFPTTDENPVVIHERRKYHYDAESQLFKPAELIEPLDYKSVTTATIVDDSRFGLPDANRDVELDTKTRVVRVDGLVTGIDDKRDVRGFLVKMPASGTGAATYLVVEADTGTFYYSLYDRKAASNIQLKKMDVSANGFDYSLIREYYLLKNPFIAAGGGAPDYNFIALPTLDHLFSKLEQKLTIDELTNLKSKISKLDDIKKREFVATAWNKDNVLDIEVIIPALKIQPIPKPLSFHLKSASEQNEFYAKAARQQVDQQVQATGLGPVNQRFPTDAQDLRRLGLAQPIVFLEYEVSSPTTNPVMLLKTGAGNCDQMAAAAAAVINNGGGNAAVWRMPGHVFTLVGGPPKGVVASTIDFSESAFRDAWIVDPWAGITCRAVEYKALLAERMAEWSREGKEILITDWIASTSTWLDPLKPEWMNNIEGPKSFSY